MPSSAENELNIRRKGFYKRNGFYETGYFTFYDDTEFEIGCAGMEFNVKLFGEFTEHLSTKQGIQINKKVRILLQEPAK